MELKPAPDSGRRFNSGIQPVYAAMRNVTKVYPAIKGDGVLALKDINFDLLQGEFLSILGPSGCGKSTLLKALAGLVPITSGSITVRGQAVHDIPDKMGIVFQRDVLLEWQNILDNVLLPIRFRGLSVKAWRPRARELLETLGLKGVDGRYPWELSGGMRQRASICRALLSDPEFLLMDEPFGALDALTRDELNLEIQEIWAASAKTILFITHSIIEAVFLSNRVIIMSRNPGQILDVITIDLPHPRPLSVRESPEFGMYVARIRQHFESMGFLRQDRKGAKQP